MGYLFNGILFHNIKKWNVDTCYNVSEPLNFMLFEKKPATKDHVLYDPIYMKCKKQAICRDRK